MITHILWFLCWPVLIFVSYLAVSYGVKKLEKKLQGK